jgi:glycolate dehydrogenase FAD-binding subunit
LTIDGVSVAERLEPRSVGELSELVGASAGPMVPVGAGHELGFGNPLSPVSSAIDLKRLDRITEYVPADLTIHLEAGVRLSQLREALAEQNQMLPLDPWCGPDATLGGIVSTNAQGPFRAVGTIRDWIIGMQVVHADGSLSRTGGRVVKNVTGYDLGKLYTGSLGSLGIVAGLSLKLRARYGRTASARIRAADPADAATMIGRLQQSSLDPVSFLWSGPDNEIRIRFGEDPSAVAWQLGRLPELVAGDWEEFDADAEDELWNQARVQYEALAPPVLRVAARPSKLAGLIGRYRPRAWLAHVANGIVLMSVTEDQISAVREEYPAILERAPLDLRRRIPTFGVTGAARETMLGLKQELDPSGRLNPGRHVEGETP